jgi:hypothetical protein
MQAYGPLVAKDSYLIVDRSCEKFFMTFNPADTCSAIRSEPGARRPRDE